MVSEAFEWTIICAIMLNMVFLSLNHYGQGPVWVKLDFYSNACFTAVFGLELLLKLAGLGPRQPRAASTHAPLEEAAPSLGGASRKQLPRRLSGERPRVEEASPSGERLPLDDVLPGTRRTGGTASTRRSCASR